MGHEAEEGDLPPGAEEHEEGEGGYPRSDSTYSIDIPNSVTLWEVDPRPNNSSQVLTHSLTELLLHYMNTSRYSNPNIHGFRYLQDSLWILPS